MIIKEEKKDKSYLFKLERNIKAYMLYTIIILGVICLTLAGAIITLTPLKETKPYLLFFADGETNFVKVNDANMDIRADEALLKSILAGYVKNRELINRINDIERYEIVRIQSKRQVWTAFQNLVKQPNSIYSTPAVHRDIKILNVAILSNKVATIDFYASIKDENENPTPFGNKKYRASVEYAFENSQETYNNSLKNPPGIKTNRYTLSEIVE